MTLLGLVGEGEDEEGSVTTIDVLFGVTMAVKISSGEVSSVDISPGGKRATPTAHLWTSPTPSEDSHL